MANQQHLDIIFKGVQNWNTWRETNSDERPDFSGANLEKLDLTGINLRRTYIEDLSGGFYVGANLININLTNANLTKADFTDANLTGADLTSANLWGAEMGNANFSNTNLCETLLCWADLRSVSFTGANLIKVNFHHSDLTNLDFSGTNLNDADLSEANLSGADLSNAWISNTKMRGINLTGASLTEAKLIGAKLAGANLIGTNLISASLSYALLHNTNLTDADLTDADLSGTNFNGACVHGTNLTGAHMELTLFGNVDLRNVKGLTSINHHGPSTIGIDTLSRSGGNIPQIFLRGAGVSDDLINYSVSLAKKPNRYYNCVISYSKQDQEFAEYLFNGLQQKGVRCWYASEGMITISPVNRRRVGNSFHIYDKLLLILSQHSIYTYWASLVIEETLRIEMNNNYQILFPIRLDSTILDEEMRRSYALRVASIPSGRDIADFTEWKFQNKFQEAINQLVPNLQSYTTPS